MRKRTYKQVDSSVSDSYSLLLFSRIIAPSKVQQLAPSFVKYISSNELSEHLFAFDNQMNAQTAFAIFVRSIDSGCYPPEQVLAFLKDKIDKYLSNDISLDKAMEVSKSSKRRFNDYIRNVNIVIEIDKLKHYFGISFELAVTAVCRRLEEKGIKFSDTSIIDIYHRKGKIGIDYSLGSLHEYVNIIDTMSEEYRKEFKLEFLKQYPEDIIELIKNTMASSTRRKG